jgi:hypothetical protein
MILILCLFLTLSSCASAPRLPEPAPVPEQTADDPIRDIPADEEDEPEIFVYGEIPDDIKSLPVLSFDEIWGYVVAGREQALKTNYPLSDVGYFGAEIDVYGKLTDVPRRSRLRGFPGRVHLVVACNSMALTHFILEPESAVRKQLVADLLEAAGPYDGLQIDFENIPNRDGATFLSFLQDLRSGLGNRIFTIALKARTRTLQNDVYDYGKIKPLVDRILVMAYDEHWSRGAPGPIASMGWSRQVADYALKTVGPEKLIMGLPFYGRTWGDKETSSAYVYSGIERLKSENATTELRRENGVPNFSYSISVKVRAYYEDVFSLHIRSSLYRDMGVRSIGFWRVGQEDTLIWNFLQTASGGS